MNEPIYASNYSANILLDSLGFPRQLSVKVQEVVQGPRGMESYWARAASASRSEN